MKLFMRLLLIVVLVCSCSSVYAEKSLNDQLLTKFDRLFIDLTDVKNLVAKGADVNWFGDGPP